MSQDVLDSLWHFSMFIEFPDLTVVQCTGHPRSTGPGSVPPSFLLLEPPPKHPPVVGWPRAPVQRL